MKMLAIALCGSLLAASVAAPALAQMNGGPGVWSLDRRIDEVQRGLDRGVADGAIDRHGYEISAQQLHGIRERESQWMASHGGQLDPVARQHLEDDLDSVVNRIEWRKQEWRRPW